MATLDVVAGRNAGTIAVIIKQEIPALFRPAVSSSSNAFRDSAVGSFKLRARRSSAWRPIHHHFELLGERNRSDRGFWIAALAFCAVCADHVEAEVEKHSW